MCAFSPPTAVLFARLAGSLGGEDAPESKRFKLDAGEAEFGLHHSREGAATAAPAAAATANGGISGHEAEDGAVSESQLLQQASLPVLDTGASAAEGLSPEQQAQMQQLMLQQLPLATLAPEALAAVPTGSEGQPLPPVMPLVGADGEASHVALDPAALAALNSVTIFGPDGAQLTPEQLALVFGNPHSFPWVLPPGTVLAGVPVGGAVGGDGNYKHWWEEHEEKVGCRRRGGAGRSAVEGPAAARTACGLFGWRRRRRRRALPPLMLGTHVSSLSPPLFPPLQELVQLAEDPLYRLEKLGTEELDWAQIAAYFGPARRWANSWGGPAGKVEGGVFGLLLLLVLLVVEDSGFD